MKKDTFYQTFFPKLKESSLNRLVSHISEHDCGTITAYRSEYTHKENQQRNKSLFAKLISLGYGVTAVKGSYIENYGKPDAKEVGEHVYFVVDLKDRGNLKRSLKNLGEEFDQDSILFIPKTGEKGSYLIGTTQSRDVWQRYHKEYSLPVLKTGKSDNEFLTRVKGRPFYFREQIIRESYAGNNNTLYLASLQAKKHWTEMTEDDIG